jgi:hypothetical protein
MEPLNRNAEHTDRADNWDEYGNLFYTSMVRFYKKFEKNKGMM